MAVYNDYVDTQILNERITSALTGTGSRNTVDYLIAFDTVAAHDAGSIYRVIKSIPCTAVPLEFRIWTDGVTGMNDVNVNLYKVGAGADEVGAEVLASALDLSSAVLPTAYLDGLLNIANADYGKALWELAGETINDRTSHYDIGLESVADLSEADTIVVHARFAF